MWRKHVPSPGALWISSWSFMVLEKLPNQDTHHRQAHIKRGFCMHLPPWYPQASGGQGPRLFISDTFTGGLSRALHLTAGADRRHMSFWSPPRHLSASCSSTKFAFETTSLSTFNPIKLRMTYFQLQAGNVTLAWKSISAVNLELCLDWGRSQDSGWVNHGQSSARMVGEQQLSFRRVVKPWGYKSGPASTIWYLTRRACLRLKSLEKKTVNRQREMNSFSLIVKPPNSAALTQFPGLFQLSELCISYFEWVLTL